jgi:hypothetical protein
MEAMNMKWTLAEAERLAPIAAATYAAMMADLAEVCPGKEADGFELVLALLRRCQQHAQRTGANGRI